VLHSWMHYLEVGSGSPVLLLHGNPTSSFLWRHVLKRAANDLGHRWIAPDLIGMGASGKPPLDYRLVDHLAYVEAFAAALGLTDLVVVGHDWGVAIAIELLRRHPAQIRAVGFMEGHLRPLIGWEQFDDGGRELFQQLRSPGVGEQMVLDDNFFVDVLLPAGIRRGLTESELAVYRSPYPDAESRRPLLQWAREIPVGGEPAGNAELMAAAADQLAASDVPKLLVHGDPGVLISAASVARCQQDLSRLTTSDVGGPAGHFLPEDRPEEVAAAVTEWVRQLP
jgi:haloalkane dehalogenase